LPIFGQLSLLENDSNSVLGYNQNRRNYQPILTRSVRDSVEVKIEKYQNKKTKLGTSKEDDET
jgi:hypothetical protein